MNHRYVLQAVLMTLGLVGISQGYAKAITFENDPDVIAKTLSHTQLKMEGYYVRKDVSTKQKELRESMKIIHFTSTKDFGVFDHRFCEISEMHVNIKKGSPLGMNSDGSKTSHFYKNTTIVAIDDDGTLLFPTMDPNVSGEHYCHLAQGTKTLYCTGISRYSVQGHDYEAMTHSQGDVTPLKKT